MSDALIRKITGDEGRAYEMSKNPDHSDPPFHVQITMRNRIDRSWTVPADRLIAVLKAIDPTGTLAQREIQYRIFHP